MLAQVSSTGEMLGKEGYAKGNSTLLVHNFDSDDVKTEIVNLFK